MKPQLGMYLFVGGPADGQRRYVGVPCDIHRLYTHDPAPFRMSDEPLTISPMRLESYHLVQLREGDQRYYVYVYGRQSGGELIRAIIKGYRQP